VRGDITGLLVKPRMEAVIRGIHRLKEDCALRDRVCAEAKRFVAESHTITKMVSEMEKLYLQSS
jgi:hypothetical protein